ncbi:MAG: hypothetical protein V7K98_01435 [Nostoc sp.]
MIKRVRYELSSNTTPVATTQGTSLRVHQSPTALDSPQRLLYNT